ncbi:MAG: hypothetical protein H6728_05765 [Myxococcales bacterium]|nr:hypothetical protein [Myxococcales bacterium]MCB9642564.1 hypothetical protein [Myxococcales bacterium]
MSQIKKTPERMPTNFSTPISSGTLSQQAGAQEITTPVRAEVGADGKVVQRWNRFLNESQPGSVSLVAEEHATNDMARSVLRHQIQASLVDLHEDGPSGNRSWQTTGIPAWDQQIDQWVDKMIFDPREGLGMPGREGKRGSLSLRSDAAVQASTAGTPTQAPMDVTSMMLRQYGAQGQTLGEIGGAVVDKSGSFFQQTPFGNLSGSGSATLFGARARAYGDVDPNALAAEFGVEANVTLADVRGQVNFSQEQSLAGFTLGRQTQVEGRLYAGADAWVDTRVSLLNGPRLKVGAGAFAGASAELAGSETFSLNGRQVGGGFVSAKAWAGAGAKLDIDMGIENGKLNFRFDVGAALGVGLELDFGFEVDFNEIAGVVKDAVKGVISKFLPFLNDPGVQGSSAQQQMTEQMFNEIMLELQMSMMRCQEIFSENVAGYEA